LRIYARWGHLMFESTDPLAGWNGTDYQPSPDVEDGGSGAENAFVWTLVATFRDGRSIYRHGYVTLIR
jgi:hypothetical protein